ncbi:glycosyltransferase [Cryobacterium sp. SO2]|uniref:glycosyltransferase n=1 Tax=Cryobacterium sp. SO2 TaxID=1897060 RepID=UPI00223CB4CD|nr:glycosyltransferase [Cryobacterium sp. SO2]WEO76925.1 glycosyltransferase [Cryobacterium sp. SO2]
MAVIVVTWNSAAVLGDLIMSVQASEVNGRVRLIVVDNASQDGSVALVRSLMPDAQIVQTGRNAGYAAGANAGMVSAEGADAFLLVNPDVRLAPGAIQAMVDEMHTTGAGIVVPRLTDQFGALRSSLRREPTVARAWGEAMLGGHRAGRIPALGEVEERPELYDRPGRADWATGAALLISRPCWVAVGPWDESYFLYSEETDFALRARDAGFELRYTPAAVAVHFEGDSHESAALFALLSRNRVKLFRSRHGRVPSTLFWAGALVGELIRVNRPVRRAAARALMGVGRGIAGPTP